MKTFKKLLTAIQTFMDTEIELTEQAISHVQRRPRINYLASGMFVGSWAGMGILLSHMYNNILWMIIFYGFSVLFLLVMFIGYFRSKA